MDPLLLPNDVHRALAVELIRTAPSSTLDDVIVAVCERIKDVDKSERGLPSQLERVARLLRAFERSVHLAPIIYDALSTKQIAALLVLALDQFAIDAPNADLVAVADAAERFVHAVHKPSVEGVLPRRTSSS